MKFKVLIASAAFAVASTFAQAEIWTLDKVHSSITFKVTHMVVSKTVGKFDKFDMDIQWDEKKPANSKVSVTIDAASVNTGDVKRDEHLRGSDFFDVAKYPTVTFVSDKIVAKGKNKYEVQGKLTLRGVTKNAKIVLDARGPIKNPYAPALKGGVEGKFVVNRKDYGMTYNSVLDAGGLAIGEDVDVELQFEADKPVAAEPAPAADTKKKK